MSNIHHTTRWQKARARQLRRQPLCQPCLANGRTTPATEVDHIIPIADGGADFALDNIQSICRACHDEKSHREHRARQRMKAKAKRLEAQGKPAVWGCDVDGRPLKLEVDD